MKYNVNRLWYRGMPIDYDYNSPEKGKSFKKFIIKKIYKKSAKSYFRAKHLEHFKVPKITIGE